MSHHSHRESSVFREVVCIEHLTLQFLFLSLFLLYTSLSIWPANWLQIIFWSILLSDWGQFQESHGLELFPPSLSGTLSDDAQQSFRSKKVRLSISKLLYVTLLQYTVKTRIDSGIVIGDTLPILCVFFSRWFLINEILIKLNKQCLTL